MIIIEFLIGIIRLFLAIIFEGLIIGGLFKLARYVGVWVLYLAGHIKSFFSPAAKIYSFKQIWNMEYDKKDKVLMMAEETGQIIIGAVTVFLMITALTFIS